MTVDSDAAEVPGTRLAAGGTSSAGFARHLRDGRVRLVLVGGLPGTGKSTVAARLAEAMGCTMLSSDVVRKQLAGLDPLRNCRGAVDTGLYAPAMIERTYDVLLHRARAGLEHGRSVILDASWNDDRQRMRAERLVRQTWTHLVEFECVAPREVALRRIASRTRTASDATADVYASMAATWRPWPTARRLSTTRPLEDVVERALTTAGWASAGTGGVSDGRYVSCVRAER